MRLWESLPIHFSVIPLYAGKSNKLGQGGRAAQLKAKGVPDAVIGAIARAKRAAPGQANYHGGRKGKSPS